MRAGAAIFLLSLAAALTAAQGDAGNRVSVSRMRADLRFLTSDVLEGRLSLERGSEIAARFVAAEFEKAGLAPASGDSYLQAYALTAYEPDPARTRLVIGRGAVETACHVGPEFRGTFHEDVTVTAPVVFAGYGITAPEYGYDDYAGVEVTGRIVLVFDHEPQETDPASIFNGTGHTRHASRASKVLNAQRHGAVGVLISGEPNRRHPWVFDPPPTAADGKAPRRMAPLQTLAEGLYRIPIFSVSDTIAESLLASAGKTASDRQRAIDGSLAPMSTPLDGVVVEMTAANLRTATGTSWNVAGLLEGSDPELSRDTILIGSHYDHLGVSEGVVFHGANDNGSGTVAVIELARAFAASERTKRSLLFVSFGSEEEGLSGSYFYTLRPLRPLDRTRAVVNLDMIARDEAHIPQSLGVVEIADDPSDEINVIGGFYSRDLKSLIESAAEATGLRVSDKFDRDHDMNALFRCDHYPFLLQGVPSVWLFGGWHPGYHEGSDTVDGINWTKLEKVTNLARIGVRALADAARPPAFVAAPHGP